MEITSHQSTYVSTTNGHWTQDCYRMNTCRHNATTVPLAAVSNHAWIDIQVPDLRGATLGRNAQDAGKIIDCPQCGNAVRVPEPDEARRQQELEAAEGRRSAMLESRAKSTPGGLAAGFVFLACIILVAGGFLAYSLWPNPVTVTPEDFWEQTPDGPWVRVDEVVLLETNDDGARVLQATHFYGQKAPRSPRKCPTFSPRLTTTESGFSWAQAHTRMAT